MRQSLFVCTLLCFTASLNAQKNEFANGLYWELNSGVLTISGNGSIPDYTHPWNGKGNVEKIVIQDGVTSIGQVTFWEYNKPHHLKSVIIGNSVTSIGERAFSDCSLLQSVTIGNSVTSIGDCAFNGCTSLQSIIIPNSVTYIAQDAFSKCPNLQSIIVPSSATSSANNIMNIATYGSDKLTVTMLIPGPNNSKYSIVTESNPLKCGLKNSEGNWVVPMGTYKWIGPFEGNYLKTADNGKYGLITYNGTEVIAPEVDALEQAGKGFLRFKINGFWGVMNYQGKIIIPTERGYTKIGNYVSLTKRFPYEMDGYKGECNNLGVQVSKIKVTAPKQTTTTSSSSSSTTSTSTTSSSSSSNKNNSSSGNTTQTVVVEHHRDPVPVQEWQACFGCGGMGTMGCDNCGGSGTKYIGDRLHRCSRCNGQGIIPCNICHGNKGQYTTVYR